MRRNGRQSSRWRGETVRAGNGGALRAHGMGAGGGRDRRAGKGKILFLCKGLPEPPSAGDCRVAGAFWPVRMPEKAMRGTSGETMPCLCGDGPAFEKRVVLTVNDC